MRAFCEGCLVLIMIVAGLAFVGSLAASSEDVIAGLLGMGFSAIVFTLGLVGLVLGDVWTELRVLTQRRRQRQEAERRAEAAKRDIEWRVETAKRKADAVHQTWLAEEEKAMQISREDLIAQRKADWGHRREMWRGRWARFWNGVRRRIARMLGEENEILIDLAYGVLKTLACLAPFVALAAAAIIAWSLL